MAFDLNDVEVADLFGNIQGTIGKISCQGVRYVSNIGMTYSVLIANL